MIQSKVHTKTKKNNSNHIETKNNKTKKEVSGGLMVSSIGQLFNNYPKTI